MAHRPDVRLWGLAAASVAGAYLLALFLPKPLYVRLGAGVAAVTVAMVIAYFALPPWRESEQRKALAGRVMIGEAAVIAFIGTLIKLALR